MSDQPDDQPDDQPPDLPDVAPPGGEADPHGAPAMVEPPAPAPVRMPVEAPDQSTRPPSNRRPVPLLIMAILGVLTIGAIVSGLLLAPASADLRVQNAAGENLLAPSLTVHVVVNETAQVGSLRQRQPTITQTFVVHPTAAPSRTIQGQRTAGIVSILHAISTSSPWVAELNSYRYTGSIASLLGLSQNVSENGVTVHIKASGSAHTFVRGMYLGTLHVQLTVAEGQQVAHATETFTFTKIG